MSWGLSFGVGVPSRLKGVPYTIFRLLNKTLSSNVAVTLVRHFKSLLQQDISEEITHSPNTSKGILLFFFLKLL